MLVVLAPGASPLDWVVGMGLLVWVLGEYAGIPCCLAQAPQTIPGHPGHLYGDTLHYQSLLLAWVGVYHQMSSLGHLGMKGEMVCYACL